jgi:hypothetical protein
LISVFFALLIKLIGVSFLQIFVFALCSTGSIYFVMNFGQSGSYYLAGIATWFGLFYFLNKLFNFHIINLRFKPISSSVN